MRDAIDVSFMETLDFSDTKKRTRQWAWDMLPDSLKEMYIGFHGRSGADLE